MKEKDCWKMKKETSYAKMQKTNGKYTTYKTDLPLKKTLKLEKESSTMSSVTI